MPAENGFNIDRRLAGGAWSQIATVGANVTAFNDSTASPATAYEYRVRAFNVEGNSPHSNIAAVTTPGSGGELGFRVERRLAGGAWSEIATVGANVTSYDDPTVVASIAYGYRVRASNAGEDSDYSNEALITPPSSSTALLYAGPDTRLIERGFLTSSRTITRRLRAVNGADQASAYVSVTKTFPAPTIPTLTKDTARANPLSLPVHVATSTARHLILSTILQVRTSGAATWPATSEGTSGTFRFSGAPPTIHVPWAAGGTMEFRVAHEDIFTLAINDRVWSATGSHTFATFPELVLDPNSNFLKKASWRYPIFKGGGQIDWTSDFKVKWSQIIAIDGIGNLTSTTGEVQIAANSAGTTLAAGQGLILRHTLGATTATMIVVTISSWTLPAEDSATTEILMFRRNADNSLSTYLLTPLLPGEHMDASVHIPLLSSQEARIGTALISDANILRLRAGLVYAEALDAHIVFGDAIGSRNFVAPGDLTAQEELAEFDAGGFSTRAVAYGNCELRLTAPPNTAPYPAFQVGFTWTGHNPANVLYGFKFNGAATGATIDLMFEGGGVATTAYTAGAEYKVTISTDGICRWYTDGNIDRANGIAGSAAQYPLIIETIGGTWGQPVYLKGTLRPSFGEECHPANAVGVTFDAADDYAKTAGLAAAWGNSGASSGEVIRAGRDGGIQFIAASATTDLMIGLSATDPDQNYLTIQHAIFLKGNGTIEIYESGTLRGAFGGYAAGDAFAVAREGGVIKCRRLGRVFYTSSVSTNGVALIADTSLYTPGAKVQGLRLWETGAIAQGWRGSPEGIIQLGKGFQIGEEDFYEAQARLLAAINPNQQFRGHDFGPPMIHKVASFTLLDWDASIDGADRATVWLAVTTPEKGADSFANFDSCDKARVRVLNHFGEQVWDTKPFAFVPGDVALGALRHPARYAYPDLQAIYELTFKNSYGWSEPVYLHNGAHSLVRPAVLTRSTSPAELVATVNGAHGTTASAIQLTWKRQSGARTIGFQFRLAGQTAWVDPGGTGGASFNTLRIDSTGEGRRFASGGVYDIRVSDGGYTNVVRVKIPEASLPETTLYPAIYVRAEVVSDTRVDLTWNLPSTSGTALAIYRNGVFLGNATTAGTTIYSDTTVTPDTDYEYHLVAVYAGGAAAASEIARVRTKVSANSFDPTNLNGISKQPQEIKWTWSLGTASGLVYLDWKLEGPGSWNTINLAAGTTQYSLGGLTASTTYEAQVRVSDAGANPSPTRSVTTRSGY